jgi:hypothetical protein
MALSQCDSLSHDPGIAGVKAAGHAGGRYRRHQLHILAELVCAEGFADIRVQIESHYCEDSRVILPTFLSAWEARTSYFS